MIDQKQLENEEYWNCSSNMIMNDASCTREMKSRIFMAKAALKQEEDSSPEN